MPTTTQTISAGARVVHKMYGRGVVRRLDHKTMNRLGAVVSFDNEPDEIRVMLRDLVAEPVDMPAPFAGEPSVFIEAPYRVVWPLDQVAGEGEVA